MTTVNFARSVRAALVLYEWLWRAATPLLSRNQRLMEGFPQRIGAPFPMGPFDIWIQAASAGEAYLAGMLLDHLAATGAHRILVTTNTRQGKDIIDAAVANHSNQVDGTRCLTAYFPFDRPSLMAAAVDAIQPRVVVLLETEIWPGLLKALKSNGIPCVIVNGRMRSRSLRQYLIWPNLWRSLAPERILAVSLADAERYARLYSPERVSVVPNMKFDRLRADLRNDPANPVAHLIPADGALVVLGSVRREEEEAVGRMIGYLRDHQPNLVIGLFPRHMHRIGPWQDRLASAGIPCQLRSRTTAAVAPGSVILWDVFGELSKAYAAARGTFVGGTLAPLGGQNFLEPLTCGLVPVIGPSWETFDWVGEELFAKGLVRVAADWRGAAEILLETMASPPSRKAVRMALEAYLQDHQGGTAHSATAIEALLAHRRPMMPCKQTGQ
jgi:3-deoxy-D-manno-octulosonic-acid transferase